MAKNKISISFSEKHTYLYDYVKSKDCISHYICKLIDADLNKCETDIALEKKVEEILNKLLSDKHIKITTKDIDNSKITENITTEDIDLIKKLF